MKPFPEAVQRAFVHAREALGNLLAVIHGDGGHTINRLGWEEACKTAEAKVVEMFRARDRVKS